MHRFDIYSYIRCVQQQTARDSGTLAYIYPEIMPISLSPRLSRCPVLFTGAIMIHQSSLMNKSYTSQHQMIDTIDDT